MEAAKQEKQQTEPNPPPQQQVEDNTTVSNLSAKLADSALLDMVFVMDCTGSMGSYIRSAQQTIRDIVQEIVSKEKADVRFALVSYRDHPPQEASYVTQVYKFSSSVKQMRANLDKLSASGGGDEPEAVVDGLHAALKLDYRSDATKVVILIADAPPHGLDGSGDSFPMGCPCGLDPMSVCRDMAQHGITLYCVGCEPSLTRYKSFFMALCRITGGQYCPLGDAEVLSSAVVGGVREEISLERMMRDVDSHMKECKAMGEEEQATYLQKQLQSKGVRSKHLKAQGATVAMTEDAVLMSKAATLADARSHFVPSKASPSAAGAYAAEGCVDMMDCCETLASERVLRRSVRSSACKAKGGPGLFGSLRSSLRGVFNSGSAVKESAAAPVAAEASHSARAVPSSYTVVEDEVSLDQCERMAMKYSARKKL